MNRNLIFLIISFSLLSQNVFSQKSPVDSLKISDPAPKFVLPGLAGEDVFLRDYCGELRQPWKNKLKHVVVLSFFTTYCQPCLKEIPELEKIVEKFQADELKIFLINVKESNDLVKKFVLEKAVKLPVLLDKYGIVAQKYGVISVPRIFIIDRDGKLIWVTKGYVENLSEQITKVLANQFESCNHVKSP